MIDRLSIRSRPCGWPVMHQHWDRLLFLHWRMAEEEIRPHVPGRLAIDTFDGSAWVGISPFTIYGLRPVLFPSLPLASTSHELNVRTYVHLEGVPGVWFFSLDAGNPLAVLGARLGYLLPYFHARMNLRVKDQIVTFTSRRILTDKPAHFRGQWELAEPLPAARPDSLEFFLIERYCLYTSSAGRIYRARIFHPAWPIRRASLLSLSSSMLESHGLSPEEEEPLIHAQAAPLHVLVWRLTTV
jgi:uncharacterized protein